MPPKKIESRTHGVEIIAARYASLATLLVTDSTQCLAITALDQGLVVGTYSIKKKSNEEALGQIQQRLTSIQRILGYLDQYVTTEDKATSSEEHEKLEELWDIIHEEILALNISYVGKPSASSHKKTLDTFIKLYTDVYCLEPDAASDADPEDVALTRLSHILRTPNPPILFSNTFNSGLHSEQEVKLAVLQFFRLHPELARKDPNFVIGVNMPACKRCKDSYDQPHQIDEQPIEFYTLSDTGQHGTSGKNHVDLKVADDTFNKRLLAQTKFKMLTQATFKAFNEGNSGCTTRITISSESRSRTAVPASPGAGATRRRSKSSARLVLKQPVLTLHVPASVAKKPELVEAKDTRNEDEKKLKNTHSNK